MRKAPSHRFSPIFTLTGAALLALLGALALGVSAAYADHNVTIAEGADDAYGEAVCMVTGAAGTADTAVDSVQTDLGGGGLSDTDGGGFDFKSTTVACAGTDEGGAVVGETHGADFSIVAGDRAGTGSPADEFSSRLHEAEYTNLVCGTGHAEGSADLYGPGVAFPGHPAVMDGNLTNLKTRFSISFVGGIGPLAITSFEGAVDLDTPVPDTGAELQDVDTGHGVGVVHIIASQPPPPADAPCVTDDVTGFEVSSAFEATLSGDAPPGVGNDENEPYFPANDN